MWPAAPPKALRQRVVVAADDPRILQACQAHGVQALLTRTDHASGSDRLAEACTQLGLDGDAVVVNVQGDEPLMDPALIDAVAALLPARPEASMGTAAHAIDTLADYENPNVVKVVLDARGLAHYFSRAPIPTPATMQARPGGKGQRHRPRPALLPCRLCAAAPYRHLQLPRGFSAAVSRPVPGTHRDGGGAGAVAGTLARPPHRRAHHRQAPGPGVDTPADLNRVRALLA
jgi:3-deoxy-manno-octulosonate cytidylyltransferase (CMP-KDO synthetase)